MTDVADAHLQLKKRARRRLIGAVAFAGFAAVVLPMVMDQEPKQQVQDVQIHIPGQDLPPPRLSRAAETPVQVRAPEPAAVAPVDRAAPPAEKAPDRPSDKVTEKKVEKPVEKEKVDKPAEKKADKPAEKSQDKVADKPADKPVDKAKTARSAESDAQRAAAILGGKFTDEPPRAANGNGQYVVLIGAFANQANVKQLQAKLGELSIPVYTEPLDTPEGRKTRVRAGPFAGRDAAERALDKMKRIGVGGVVAAKQ